MINWEDEAANPAKLSQMDREKARFDDLLDRLIKVHRETSEDQDGTVAAFELMEAMADIEAWKLRGALAFAIHRLTFARHA